YIGFDPTADSLHVGSLAQIMTLIHFQRAGHRPFALVGGATGMVGDPSGKSQERNLLSEEVLQHNLQGIQKQLEKFLDFDCGANSARMVNNYDWFKDYTFLNFIRDVGKHITVNYMMSKDSVKNRLNSDTGMSFTEFTYQLVQGYDFYYLWKHYNCALQMGGSDQWGNIVTGTELIRRKDAGEAFALTTQLIKKADGSKFGKTEGGNIWLDPEKTSPYKFYQFWLNTSDEDAKAYIRIFTLFDRETIEALEAEHTAAPHLRALQKALAKDITIRTHNEAEYHKAVKSSEFLFGNTGIEFLNELTEMEILALFEGVPNFNISKTELAGGIGIADLLAVKTAVFPSKGEAKKMIQGGGVAVNKSRVGSEADIYNLDKLINGKFLVAQKGKKNYFLIIAE
ncbi:MAG: tyrosine--tRNA ligase, partial [Bacteroidetes bacterium]|nr:tyrosine--tRNA ligase [Bacteroidota bacterium]